MIRRLTTIALTVLAAFYMLRQVRKPGRWVGRLFLWSMNQSHSALTDWGLEHVSIESRFTILDVGCGGGRTIHKMGARATEGRVVGVDYSVGSVEASRATNAALIREGRCEIRQASVSRLPFEDASFDLVTAVETHYYWPDLPGDAGEILRVLKPGGALLVVAESYRGARYDFAQGMVMTALGAARLSADEHRLWLETAGFAAVEVHEERRYGWICVIGRRPATTATTRPAIETKSGVATL